MNIKIYNRLMGELNEELHSKFTDIEFGEWSEPENVNGQWVSEAVGESIVFGHKRYSTFSAVSVDCDTVRVVCREYYGDGIEPSNALIFEKSID